MVQALVSGRHLVFDWTDAAHPKEIAFFDRGPMDSTKFVDAGYWSAYWYNGYIYGSEIARGLDIFALKPSGFISQNEIDAAKLVQFDCPQCPGSAPVRLASELRGGPSLSRPAQSRQRDRA